MFYMTIFWQIIDTCVRGYSLYDKKAQGVHKTKKIGNHCSGQPWGVIPQANHVLFLCTLFLLVSPSDSCISMTCLLSLYSALGIWVMAQAQRGFLLLMSSSMPWSLPQVSQYAGPQWKMLTHQLLTVAQQEHCCPHPGMFHNRWFIVSDQSFFIF